MASTDPSIESPRAGGGIPESELAGPFPVGEYAAALRGRLRSFARVQLVGELVNLRPSRARVYFELRDAGGALPCALARRLGGDPRARRRRAGRGRTGRRRGRLRLLPGQRQLLAGASPSPSPTCAVAGEGDLLARVDRAAQAARRRRPAGSRRKLLSTRALVPRSIGVITAERGQGARRRARRHCAGAAGRGAWSGGFAPVQDRHAAPAIVRALSDLTALAEVDVVIVARGGGSLADLLCFLRRDALPHGGAAARARDRVGRPPHGSHAARRRRGRQLLDADPRRRGGRRGSTARPPAPQQAGSAAPPARARAPRGARPRAPAGVALARAGRARRAPARAPAPASARESAQARAGAWMASGAGHRAARAGRAAQGRGGASPDCRRRRPRELEAPGAGARGARARSARSSAGYAVVEVGDRRAADEAPRGHARRASCACASPTARCGRGVRER